MLAVNSIPKMFLRTLAVFNEANHESAFTTLLNFVSRFLSDMPMLLSIRIVKVVATHTRSTKLLRRIRSIPSCNWTSIHTPVDPSHTAFNSAPNGCGFRFINERWGIPSGPECLVHAIIISPGVTIEPARSHLFLPACIMAINQSIILPRPMVPLQVCPPPQEAHEPSIAEYAQICL